MIQALPGRRAVGWSACLLALCTFAQSPKLIDYYQAIDRDNPKLAELAMRYEAAKSRAQVADSLPDPELTLGFFVQPVETRVGPQEQRLSLSQKLPWPGKRTLLQEQASAMAETLAHELERERRQLHRQFTQKYADYYLMGRALQTTHDHVQLLRDLGQVITAKYESGTAPYASLIRIELEIDQLEDRIESLRLIADPIRAELNATLNRSSDASIPVPVALPSLNPELSDTSIGQHPDMQRLDATLRARISAQGTADKQRYPDFKIGLDWIQIGSAAVPGIGSGDDALVLQAGINLPIWRKRIRAQQTAATQEVTAAQYSIRHVKNQLEAQVQRAQFDRDDANRKIALYRDTVIPKSREALQVLQTSFQADRADYLDLIDAERQLLEFHLALYQAQAKKLSAEADLNYIAGKPYSESEANHE